MRADRLVAITLLLHESCLPFVKSLMPGRYHIIEPDNGDGWIIAHFHLESMDLAKMLVFGLGTQVAVVEPPELHAAVVQTAREMLN